MVDMDPAVLGGTRSLMGRSTRNNSFFRPCCYGTSVNYHFQVFSTHCSRVLHVRDAFSPSGGSLACWEGLGTLVFVHANKCPLIGAAFARNVGVSLSVKVHEIAQTLLCAVYLNHGVDRVTLIGTDFSNSGRMSDRSGYRNSYYGIYGSCGAALFQS